MPARLAGKACENNGMRLAHLTSSNISNAAHLLAGSDHDAAWIASYEQRGKPRRGCLVLRAGDPITIAGIKRHNCRKMRHVAICESLSKDNSEESTSDTTSTTLQPDGHKRHAKRAASSSASERCYLRRIDRSNPPRTVDVGIKSFRLPEKGLDRRIKSSSKSSSNSSSESRMRNRHHRSHHNPGKRTRCMKPCKKSFDKKSCRRNRCKKSKRRNRCKKSERRTSSSSSSSSSSSRSGERRHHRSTRSSFPLFLSKSSSSSSSRSISVDINFSQEDAAILGSHDQPAVAFHHRHYSRRLRREARSRSRSRSRRFSISC